MSFPGRSSEVTGFRWLADGVVCSVNMELGLVSFKRLFSFLAHSVKKMLVGSVIFWTTKSADFSIALYRDSHSISHGFIPPQDSGSKPHFIVTHKWIRTQLGDQHVCFLKSHGLQKKHCKNAFHINPDPLLLFWVSVESLIAKHLGGQYFCLSVGCERLTSAQKL